MKKKILVISGAVLAIGSLLGLFSLPHSIVEANDETADNPISSIRLSPVSKRLTLNSNELVDSKIKITNTGSKELNFRVYSAPYGVVDISYDADFERQTDYTKLSNWINFEKTEYTKIASGDTVDVPYNITVPEDIPGGGQYAVIFAETLPENDDQAEGTSIQTVGRVGSLLYADLGGETRREGELISFNQPTFVGSTLKPVAQIRNSGNIDFDFTHSTNIKTLFGKEVFNNSISRSVLPATTREVAQEWSEAPVVGIYMVNNKISFLNETHVDETKLVYIGPLWILITVLIILGLILILIVVIIIRKVRNNKKNKSNIKQNKYPKTEDSNKESVEKTDEVM